MNKLTLAVASAAFCLAQGAIAAPGSNSARSSFTADPAVSNANPAPRAIVVDEGFDDITTLPGAGWTLFNNSAGIGSTGWFQGNDVVFNAFDGATTAYIGANYNNTDGGSDGASGIISNWMVSPPINFGTGATVSFYTRTSTGSIYPDRLQVRVCPATSCTNFGAAGDGTGDFTILVSDINAAEAVGGYPDAWTQFTLTNAEGLPSSGTGQVAFRYYVHGSGPLGDNGNYIGIDRVNIEEGVVGGGGTAYTPPATLPSLGTSAMIGLGALLALFGFAGLRRRRMN